MEFLEDTSKHIGQLVRERRREQRLDQQTLALVANVGVRTVHRIEAGETTVRLDGLLKVLAALGLELSVRQRSA